MSNFIQYAADIFNFFASGYGGSPSAPVTTQRTGQVITGGGTPQTGAGTTTTYTTRVGGPTAGAGHVITGPPVVPPTAQQRTIGLGAGRPAGQVIPPVLPRAPTGVRPPAPTEGPGGRAPTRQRRGGAGRMV